MRILYTVFTLCIMCCSSVVLKAQHTSLEGKWVINYIGSCLEGIYSADNMDSDTFLITKNADQTYAMKCTSYSNFKVSDIKAEKELLSFVMTNNVDPKSLYTMKYTLRSKSGDNVKVYRGVFVNQLHEYEVVEMVRVNK